MTSQIFKKRELAKLALLRRSETREVSPAVPAGMPQSTLHERPGALLGLHSEDEPLSPLGVYAQTKAAGDEAVDTTPRHYLARTSWVVGEGRNLVRTMTWSARVSRRQLWTTRCVG